MNYSDDHSVAKEAGKYCVAWQGGRTDLWAELGVCHVLQAVLQLVCKFVAVRASLSVLNMVSYL